MGSAHMQLFAEVYSLRLYHLVLQLIFGFNCHTCCQVQMGLYLVRLKWACMVWWELKSAISKALDVFCSTINQGCLTGRRNCSLAALNFKQHNLYHWCHHGVFLLAFISKYRCMFMIVFQFLQRSRQLFFKGCPAWKSVSHLWYSLRYRRKKLADTADSNSKEKQERDTSVDNDCYAKIQSQQESGKNAAVEFAGVVDKGCADSTDEQNVAASVDNICYEKLLSKLQQT